MNTLSNTLIAILVLTTAISTVNAALHESACSKILSVWVAVFSFVTFGLMLNLLSVTIPSSILQSRDKHPELFGLAGLVAVFLQQFSHHDQGR